MSRDVQWKAGGTCGSWWGWRGLNPHVACATQDFKSCAYANFATSPRLFELATSWDNPTKERRAASLNGEGVHYITSENFASPATKTEVAELEPALQPVTVIAVGATNSLFKLFAPTGLIAERVEPPYAASIRGL